MGSCNMGLRDRFALRRFLSETRGDIYDMDFVATFSGAAKFEGEVGILLCHSICLITGVKFAVQHIAVDVVAWLDLVAPVRVLTEEPLPKPRLSRYAIVNSTVFGTSTLLACTIRHIFRPLDMIPCRSVLMFMTFKNKT